jgi:hypothetical protein
MARLLLSLSLLFTSIIAPVTIQVMPHVLQAGGAIRIRCRVVHDAHNRRLILALEGYRTSEWQLDGEAAPALFERVLEHVPCGVEQASCTLINDQEMGYRATAKIVVAGCDNP